MSVFPEIPFHFFSLQSCSNFRWSKSTTFEPHLSLYFITSATFILTFTFPCRSKSFYCFGPHFFSFLFFLLTSDCLFLNICFRSTFILFFSNLSVKSSKRQRALLIVRELFLGRFGLYFFMKLLKLSCFWLLFSHEGIKIISKTACCYFKFFVVVQVMGYILSLGLSLLTSWFTVTYTLVHYFFYHKNNLSLLWDMIHPNKRGDRKWVYSRFKLGDERLYQRKESKEIKSRMRCGKK